MGADGIPRSDSKCERITLGASTWMCTSVESHKLQVSEGTFIVHQSHLDKAEFTEGLPLAAGFRTDPRGQDGGRGLAKPLQGSRRERGGRQRAPRSTGSRDASGRRSQQALLMGCT